MDLLLRYLIKDKSERKGRKKEKSPAPGGNRTLDLTITRPMSFRCATTTAQWPLTWVRPHLSLNDFLSPLA